jgi:hypothetical protein
MKVAAGRSAQGRFVSMGLGPGGASRERCGNLHFAPIFRSPRRFDRAVRAFPIFELILRIKALRRFKCGPDAADTRGAISATLKLNLDSWNCLDVDSSR